MASLAKKSFGRLLGGRACASRLLDAWIIGWLVVHVRHHTYSSAPGICVSCTDAQDAGSTKCVLHT